MLSEIEVPYIAERFIGISNFHQNEIFAISYEGIHKITVGNEIKVTSYPEFVEGGDIYDWKNSILDFENKKMPIMGLFGRGTPILESPDNEMLILPDNKDSQSSPYGHRARGLFKC